MHFDGTPLFNQADPKSKSTSMRLPSYDPVHVFHVTSCGSHAMSAFLGDLSIVRSSCLPPLRLLAVPMPLGSREGRGGTGHRGGRFLCAAIAAPVVLGCWTVRRRSRQSMRSSEQPEWVPTKD